VFARLRVALSRLRGLFRRAADDRELDDELAAHLAMREADLIRRGLAPDRARREALVELGGLAQLREAHRELRGPAHLDAYARDVRYAFRMLRRNSSLTIFAVLIVGLGVGGTTTVFSIVNALWLRPLPFEDPGRLAWIANGDSENLSDQTVQVANLLDFRAQSQAFSAVAAFSPFYGVGDIRFTDRHDPERLTGIPVTEGFFELLGLQPHLGRFFVAEECLWNAPKAVLLSHAFWRRRFAADPAVVGRAITLDGTPTTVVGVLPASFDFSTVFTPGIRADVFLPYPTTPETNRQGNTLAAIGRLKPGVNLRIAQSEAAVIAERIANTRHDGEGRGRNKFQPNLSSLRDRVSGRFHYALVVLIAAVSSLMLLVCANLANLLLGRASVRKQEMALRTALGAERRQLVRQMLIESLMMSGAGAALGLAIAIGGTGLVAGLEGTTVPLLQDVRVDGVALALTLLVAVLTAVAFGLLPAVQASSVAPDRALKMSSRGSTAGSRARLWQAIVISEIALACVLMTGAGLLARSLIRVLGVDPGFASENVITLRVDPGREYSTLEHRNAYFDDVLHGVRSVPGVVAAGLTDALPLGENYGWRLWSASPKEHASDRRRRVESHVRIVDGGYFDAMRIPLRSGRVLSAADRAGGERVAVVNEALARALWPDADPLGQSLITNQKDWRVVGVVRETRYFGLEQNSGPEFYLPIAQMGDYSSVDLVVRSSNAPASIVPGLRTALGAVDANLPTTEFRTMGQLLARSTFPRRAVALLVAGFAVFGLVLAALGIYAVISYSVSQRKHEISIRMALGASPRDLRSHVLMETARLVALGLTIGFVAAAIGARAIQSLLFGIEFFDPLTFAVVVVVLAGVSTAAGYVPARRASRIDPLSAVRAG
jgi:predicted permease